MGYGSRNLFSFVNIINRYPPYFIGYPKMKDRKIYKELLRRAKEIEKEDDVAIVMINVIEKKLIVVRNVKGG